MSLPPPGLFTDNNTTLKFSESLVSTINNCCGQTEKTEGELFEAMRKDSGCLLYLVAPGCTEELRFSWVVGSSVLRS